MQHWKQNSLSPLAKETANSWAEPRDVTSTFRGKEPLVAPPGSRGETTSPGMSVNQAVQASPDVRQSFCRDQINHVHYRFCFTLSEGRRKSPVNCRYCVSLWTLQAIMVWEKLKRVLPKNDFLKTKSNRKKNFNWNIIALQCYIITMLYTMLQCSAVQQHESQICIQIPPPSEASLPPQQHHSTPLGHHRYQGNISGKDGFDKGQKWYGPNRSRRY